MKLVRVAATVAVSLGAALALGQWFQPQPGAPAPLGAAPAAPADPARLSLAVPGEAALGAPVFAMLSGTEGAETPAPAPRITLSQTPGNCAPVLTLAPQTAAMLAVTLRAPCDSGEPVAIAHGPLLLAAVLDADGMLRMDLPALSPEAEVTVALLDGRLAIARAEVPDFARFQRLVVTWDGPAVLDLHAYAGGAGWGEAGHVRAGMPVAPDTGFILAFGDPDFDGPQARIYTWPADIGAAAGQVRLEAEVALDARSCGTTLSAQVHAIRDAAPVARRALDVAMPACGGPDGFVLVPDLVPDMAAGLAALN